MAGFANQPPEQFCALLKEGYEARQEPPLPIPGASAISAEIKGQERKSQLFEGFKK